MFSLRLFTVIVLSTFIIPIARTQSISKIGARSAGLSGATVAYHQNDIYIDNQALLANVESLAFGFHYYNRFEIPELSTQTVSLLHTLGNGGMGYKLSYFGNLPYNEINAGIAYGLNITEKIALGAEIDFHRTSLETEEDDLQAVSGEIGFLYFPITGLIIGLQATTISNSDYFDYERNQINSGVRSGVAFAIENFGLFTELEIQNNSSPLVKAGTELEFIENLKFRFGVSNGEYAKYSFGLGYALKGIYADIGFSKHPYLGFSSSASLGYVFNSQ